MGVQQHGRRAGRCRSPAEHGRLPAVGREGSSTSRPAAPAAPRRPRALRRIAAAAAGSADTDGMRTSGSRGRPARRAGTRATAARRSGHRQPAYICRSVANRSVISITRCSSGCRTMTVPSLISGRPPVPPLRADRQQVDQPHRIAVLGEQLVQPLDAGDRAGALRPLEDACRRCTGVPAAARAGRARPPRPTRRTRRRRSRSSSGRPPGRRAAGRRSRRRPPRRRPCGTTPCG